MELTDEQKQQVRTWIEEGSGLSEVQSKLSTECGIAMTYMDVRFLVLDLGAEVKDKEPEPVRTPVEDEPVGEPTAEGAMSPGDDLGAGAAGGVSMEIDRITKPGAVASGTVVFSDGTNATWAVDQLGRLALDAGDADYRPSEDDVMAFQMELQKAFTKRGL